jgi:gliding motility-associated lipoprotein GldH
MRPNKLLCLLTVALAFASCNRNALYSHYQPVDLNGWQRADTIRFETAPLPHSRHYSETLGLRINGNYPFMQLTLIVSQEARPSGFQRTDTIHASLTDKNGTILGEGINHYLYTLPLPNVELQQGDTLSVCVHHDMLRDPLTGVADIGFTIE